MEMSDEQKSQILKGFIDLFTRISSIEYQKRIWIREEGPEADDFDDVVNEFFIECDSILDNYRDFGMTLIQYQILKNFKGKFREFSDEHDFPQEFIDTLEWKKITEMAKDVLAAFNYQKIR